MTKNKKIITCIVLSLFTIFVCLSAIWGICYYANNNFTFVINDTLPNGEGKKAKVIIIGGQSNASGWTSDQYLQNNISSEKYLEYENGFNNVYINYLAGSKQSEAFVTCTTKQGELDNCFGLELGLAEKLHKTYPNELFFIIKCAWGGTNLHSQWLSPSSSGRTGRLYKQFVSFVNTSMQYLISKNYDVQIDAMCWMQGESDSDTYEHATLYKDHLTNFINDIRNDFTHYTPIDGIKFIDAYIADNPISWKYYEQVNNSKKQVAELSSINVVIDTIAHGLSFSNEPLNNPDLWHYDSLSEIKLGHLFAEELFKFIS